MADFDAQATYDLETEELECIKQHFNLDVGTHAGLVKLRPRHFIDDLPYQVHTNRELALMLAGKKPFAAFSGTYPSCPGIEEIPERLFDPYVATGRLLKREYVEPMREGMTQQIRRVMYALHIEAWRINAYVLLLQTARKVGWNEGFERMEGSLLGYEEWQNDAYIEAMQRRNQQA